MALILADRRPAAPLVKAVLGLLAVGAIALVASWMLGDPERHRAFELALQSPTGLIGLFVLSALSSATLLLPVPGIALTVLAATVANPLLVGLAAGLGQTAGELTGYLAGASGAGLLGERATSSRMAHWMRHHAAVTLFCLGLVPNPVFDVAGMLAGAVKVPVSTFLVAVGSGKTLRNVLIAFGVAHGSGLL